MLALFVHKLQLQRGESKYEFTFEAEHDQSWTQVCLEFGAKIASINQRATHYNKLDAVTITLKTRTNQDHSAPAANGYHRR